ncbi:MAG: PKD domain-containing protein, partial [Flavobacteriales bacterium]|nr:PKD domain-containing protein [Flavobacteriales bacterium]
HGDNSGEINVEGSGGTSPYTYQVDGGSVESSGVFSGLEAGTHAIQIVDGNLCVFDTTIVLTEPDTLVLDLVEAHDLLCNGDNSGWMTVVGTGGVIPYEYNLDGGAYDESATFNGLAAGNYIVGVMDANGCTDTLHVTLTEPGVLQLSLMASDSALCFGASNGFIETAAASGTPPYQFSIDGVNYQGDSLFQGLSAGTYTVTVMDANGCLDDITETIFEPTELTIETASVPVSCFGDQNGEIQITADGGTPGYEYSIDGGGSFDPNGGSFADLPSGNYLAVVQDFHGCSASEGVVISEPSSAFDLDAVVTDVGCLGDSTGSVLLVGSGGTPTYTYSSDNATFVTPNTFGGYPLGAYTFYARDLNGCADSVQVSIGEPATSVEITNTLTANPACPNEGSGSVTVQAVGGTPDYMYSSNGGTTFQAGQILSGLGGGNHLIVVSDANGCLASDTVELISPPLLSISVDSLVGVDCEGDLDGEIHVTASGGTPSYNYSLDNGNIQSNGDFTNLTYGDHSLTIMDVNGCTFSQIIVVPANQMLPVADFSFYIVAESVLFANESMYADSSFWDFGDGNTSSEESPTHVYDAPGDYTVTLTVFNDCGSATVTVYVSTINTGIDSETLSFGLYPNPADNEIFIQTNRAVEENFSLEIISASGQLIRAMQKARFDANGRFRVELNGLTQGIYYLRIQSEKEQSVLRFDIIK